MDTLVIVMNKKRMEITVKGDVQGVFYRTNAKTTAEELGLTGYVENRSDGTVFIDVEGAEEDVREFLQWSEAGSPQARVDSVEHLEFDDIKGYQRFEIKA